MKLKLKHLTGYLPYDLRIARFTYEGEFKRVEYSLRGTNINEVLRYNNLKPILLPLQEMYNIPEIMDEFSEHSLEQFEISFFTDLGRCGNCFDFVNYTLMELFFKHHLDIFGLIPGGLAVDKNTLE